MSGKLREKRRIERQPQPPAPPQHQPKARPSESGFSQRTVWAIVAFGLLFSFGVIREWEPLNGIWKWTKWEWRWQDLGVAEMAMAGLLPLLGIGLVLWRVQQDAEVERPLIWAVIAAVSNFLFQLLTTIADPRGLARVSQIVASPDATAYYTDATAIQNLFDWLAKFQEVSLHGHASTHPAGPILFYDLFLKLFGPEAAPFWGGIAVGLLGSATILVMYAFSGLWTPDPKVRLTACAFAALVPSSVVFFPEFDQAYPSFAMLLIILWIRSLNGANFKPALWLGAVLFFATFFAYNLLTLGAFLAFYAGYWLWRKRESDTMLHVARCTVIALGTTAAIYILFWFVTGYNVRAAFQQALSNQSGISAGLQRRYATFVVADLYDLALGAGIIVVPILVAHLAGLRKKFDLRDESTALTLIGLATVLIIDFSGLLRGEAARVWMFVMPLLVVPAALELAKLRGLPYYAMFATQWWIVVCIKAKMSFIEP